MKVIGLIGGMSPESTIMYYQVLNNLAKETYGDKHSARVLINSVDFGEISNLQVQDKWEDLNQIMGNAAKNLENGGASCVLICANTMHLTIEAVKKQVTIPIIHIAEATAEAIVAQNLKKVALLGTKYTMEKPFYANILTNYGIETMIPEQQDREIIHTIIYEELAKGILYESSKQKYIDIINTLKTKGAEGIILGCTEIPLLIKQHDVSIPVFDTTTIHATKAFNLSK
ncbi:aspartate/glutamate racemase family protein [Tenacibaculum sp. TC6]|uniref:aspartate/glutamate racemase family protein n=1 Tax=Tenacibaculum sp. TC6 TaxID=3423223 RepID=UPI003D3601CC